MLQFSVVLTSLGTSRIQLYTIIVYVVIILCRMSHCEKFVAAAFELPVERDSVILYGPKRNMWHKL
jgi:hypothetical protein